MKDESLQENITFPPSMAWAPNLEDAIERYPLTVLPTTPLMEAIALISQAHHRTQTIRSSCILVMEGTSLQGILTERDVVRLTAQAVDLSTTTVAEVMARPVITLPQHSVQDIFAALFLFRRYRIRHLPIVDDQERVVGVISNENIRQILRPINLLQHRRVADVMTTQVVQARGSASVLELAQLMASHRVSCVVITQVDAAGNQRPIGIVTERDIVQFQACQMNLVQAHAHAVMSSPLFLLSPEDSLWSAHQEMQKRRVGRLVVSWNWGAGLGIVTQTSLLRVFDLMEMYGVIETLQQTIQQLQAKPSPTALSPPVPLEPPVVLSHGPESTLPLGLTGDRMTFLGLIAQAQSTLKPLMTEQDLSFEQQRSQCEAVQTILSQLQALTTNISGFAAS